MIILLNRSNSYLYVNYFTHQFTIRIYKTYFVYTKRIAYGFVALKMLWNESVFSQTEKQTTFSWPQRSSSHKNYSKQNEIIEKEKIPIPLSVLLCLQSLVFNAQCTPLTFQHWLWKMWRRLKIKIEKEIFPITKQEENQ